MKKEESINNLVEAISFVIECGKCEDKTYRICNDNSYDIAIILYAEGWRGTDSNIYCPVCAKTFKLK